MKFKSINITTEKGLKEAERLKEKGWIVQGVGFNTIDMSYGKSDKYNERTASC